jgi:negative regulator of flagellin synthesis FlgM
MKIVPADLKAVTPATAAERKTPAPTRPAGNEPSAKVELSSQTALQGQPTGNADFDRAKVDRIAQAIRDGRFEINADAIADKLIANAQELLAKPSR